MDIQEVIKMEAKSYRELIEYIMGVAKKNEVILIDSNEPDGTRIKVPLDRYDALALRIIELTLDDDEFDGLTVSEFLRVLTCTVWWLYTFLVLDYGSGGDFNDCETAN